MSRQREKPAPSGGDNSDAWMATFSDLLMLMLTFFVLLLTMSSLDKKQLDRVVHSGLDPKPSEAGKVNPDLTEEIINTDIVNALVIRIQDDVRILAQGEEPPHLEANFGQLFAAFGLKGQAWVERRPNGFDVNLGGRIAFEPDSAELTTRSKALLEELLQTLDDTPVRLAAQVFVANAPSPRLSVVESHERDWDLALRRADGVARFTLRRSSFAPDRLEIMGFGYPEGRDAQRFLRQGDLLRLRVNMVWPSATQSTSGPQKQPNSN